MSKLNLFQCLAASRPNYEDMFCLGRHVVRDLATCARGAAMPAPIVTVSDVVGEAAPEPIIITPAPAASPPAATPRAAPIVVTPVPAPAPRRPTPPASPEPEPASSLTERLNTQPGRSPE